MIVKAEKWKDGETEEENIYVVIPKQVYELKEETPLKIFVEWVEDKPRIVFEPADDYSI